MKKIYSSLLIIAFLLGIQKSNAQQTVLISQGGTVTTCNASFFDSGGSGGAYANNENYTITFCGDGTNDSLYINFTLFNIESCCDDINIYDGPNTSSPLIGNYFGTTLPGNNGLIYSSSGCLTISFTSDGSVTPAGWASTIGCGTYVAPPAPPPASPTCAGAGGACLTNAITFPASTATGTAETGPDYDCLLTQPRPAWYYFQIGQAGNITLAQSNSSAVDVDGALWGPFTSPNTCGAALGTPIACDYLTASTFSFNIANAQVGEYYMLLITNYSGTATNITFAQTGGTGATTCNALCDLTAIAGTASACDPATSTYSVSGTITVSNPPTTGILTISDNAGASQVLNPPFATSIPFTVSGITADAASHTVTATFSGTSGCTRAFTYTAPAACCPTVAITGNTPACTGATVTLDAGAGFTTYSWTGPNGFTSSIQTAAATVAGVYTVNTTSPGGCTGTASATVVINPLPTPVITGTLSFCPNSSTTLTASAGFTTYAWTGPVTGSNATLAANAAGTYTVTVSDAAGCQGAATATVTASTAPTPTITGNLSICPGTSTQLDAGAGFTTYVWTGPVTGSLQTLLANAAGTYTVSVTDASGCSGTASATVTLGGATVTITGSTTVCAVGTTTTTLDAGTFATYSWSDGTSVIGTTQTVSVGVGTYTVTVTDNTGCTGTGTATVTATTVTVNITGQLVICAGTTTTLFATPGFIGYNWTEILPPPSPPPFPIGNLDSLENVVQGSYQVDVTDANGCSGSATAIVIENDTVPIIITGNPGICPGGTGTLLDVGTGYTNQIWATIVGTTITPVAAGQTYTATAAGLYGAQVNVATGCIGIDTITVVAFPAPVPTITGTLTYCTGTTALSTQTFSTYDWSDGTSSVGTTQSVNVAAGTYTVTVTDANGCSGTSASATVTQSTQAVVTITGNNLCSGGSSVLSIGPGFTTFTWADVSTGTPVVIGAGATQTVTTPGIYGVQASNASGCSGQDTITITLATAPTPTITGSATFCVGNSTTLDAGAGFATYSWSDGTSVVGTSQTLVVSTAGNYTVTVTNAATCQGVSSVFNVSQSSTITPTVTGALNYCTGLNTTLDAGAGYTAYTWQDANTLSIVGTSQTFTATAGTYTVTVSQGTCSGVSVNQVVTEITPPVVTASTVGPNLACQGSTITITASGATTYTWTDVSTGNSVGTNQTFQATATGSYTVYGENVPGCGSTSAPVSVTIQPNPTVTISASGPTSFCSGSVDLTASGTASGFLWTPSNSTQPTITVTQSGTVTLQGTDLNGCIGTASVTITSGNTLLVNVTSSSGTNIVCSGQPVTLDGTTVGATTYSWAPNGETTPTIPVTASGTYILTVTDGTTCQSTSSPFSITVGTTPNPVVMFTNLNDTLPNSALLCTPTSSILLSEVSGPYVTYQWSTSATDIGSSITVTQPGTYTVTVTNAAGCDATSAPFYVSYSPNSLVITADGPTNFCEGTADSNQVGLDATAGFDNYIWTSGSTTEDIVTNVPGGYYVTAYNYCYPYPVGITSNTINISITSHIQPYVVVFDDTLKAMPSAYSYQWYLNGQVIPGATNQKYVASQTGTYTVVTHDFEPCTTVSDTAASYSFTLKPNTIGFEEIDGVSGLSIFPNPTSGMLNIETTFAHSANLQVGFADMTGRNIADTFTIGGNGFVSHQVDISNLSKGVYFVSVKSNDTVITKRIIKE